MYPNFEEILEELSYKVGIVDLTNESHKQILVKLLRERGIDSAQQLTDRASVVFEYIKENTPKPKRILREDTVVKGKDSGNIYTVKTFNADRHVKPTPAEIQKAKKDNGGNLPSEPKEPTQGTSVFGNDGGASVFPEPTATQSEPKSDFSELETVNKNSLDSFVKNGFAKSAGAPGTAGSMLNEIVSTTSATNVLNSNEDFDYDSQLESNIARLKGTGLGKENDGNDPASGVKKSEAAEVGKKYGISIGLASKAIIATRAAQSKTNHVKQAIIEKNGIENSTSIPFFGDAKGLKAQEAAVNSTTGKVFLGNTEISKEEATEIIRNSGGGENPSDTSIFILNKNTGDLHMTFYSDKDNVNAIVAQSTIKAEAEFKKKQIDDFVEKGLITPEQGEVVKKTIVGAIKDYQQLETDLDTVVNEPIIHLQSVDPNTLIELTKTLSTGANKDKYWNGDKNVKGVAQLMTTSKKHMAYLPDGHATPPTEVEMMQGFIKYASDTNNTLTKPEQKVLSELSNKTNGPNLGPKLGEIRKRTVETDLNLIKKLDEQTVNINGVNVGVGTLLEAESVAEKLHLNIMFGGSGVYKDPDAFYQESGGVAVNKQTMEKCFPFGDKNDMVSHFEVGEERETTKRGETTITGGSKIVYAISKNGQRYPIGEKIQRSKSGILGKLQTVYKYHPDVQACFAKNG
jgi:hypothetical protein